MTTSGPPQGSASQSASVAPALLLSNGAKTQPYGFWSESTRSSKTIKPLEQRAVDRGGGGRGRVKRHGPVDHAGEAARRPPWPRLRRRADRACPAPPPYCPAAIAGSAPAACKAKASAHSECGTARSTTAARPSTVTCSASNGRYQRMPSGTTINSSNVWLKSAGESFSSVVKTCLPACRHFSSPSSLTVSSWFCPNWPMSRNIACICRSNVAAEATRHDLHCSLFKRNPYNCRLAAKNANTACFFGSDFCTSARLRSGGKTSSAGSRRTAISRKIASCCVADARQCGQLVHLLLGGLLIVGHQRQLAQCLADRLRASRKPLVLGVARQHVLPLQHRLRRQLPRRGFENPTQRFQPPAELERIEEPPTPRPLGNVQRGLHVADALPLHRRLEPVVHRLRLRRGRARPTTPSDREPNRSAADRGARRRTVPGPRAA